MVLPSRLIIDKLLILKLKQNNMFLLTVIHVPKQQCFFYTVLL